MPCAARTSGDTRRAVRLVVDSATRIDTSTRQVLLASGRALAYDHVIYAVGAPRRRRRRCPGWPSTRTTSPSTSRRNGGGPGWTSCRRTRRSPSSAAGSPASRPPPNSPNAAAPSPSSAGRGRAARRAGRRHRTGPHRRDRAGADRPGLHRGVRQPRPPRRRTAARAQGRHRGPRVRRWSARRRDQGGDLPVRGGEADQAGGAGAGHDGLGPGPHRPAHRGDPVTVTAAGSVRPPPAASPR